MRLWCIKIIKNAITYFRKAKKNRDEGSCTIFLKALQIKSLHQEYPLSFKN
jgi:hypothetical protein